MTSPEPDDHDDLLTLTPERIVWTVAEAAAQLKTSHSQLCRLFRKGMIGGYRIGACIYLTQADIDEFRERGRAASPFRVNNPEPAHIHIVRRTG